MVSYFSLLGLLRKKSFKIVSKSYKNHFSFLRDFIIDF